MIDLEFLESLIRAIDESSLDSIEIERGGTRVRLSKTPPSPAAAPAQGVQGSAPVPPAASAPQPSGPTGDSAAAAPEAPTPSTLIDVPSPMVGTFYRAPGPDAPPYVDIGAKIAKGDTLCIIEAMKLMNELESEVAGRVAEVLVENGEPVEFGQVLFRVEPV